MAALPGPPEAGPQGSLPTWPRSCSRGRWGLSSRAPAMLCQDHAPELRDPHRCDPLLPDGRQAPDRTSAPYQRVDMSQGMRAVGALQGSEGFGDGISPSFCCRALSKQGFFLSFKGLSGPDSLPRTRLGLDSSLSFTGGTSPVLGPPSGAEWSFRRSIAGPGGAFPQYSLPKFALDQRALEEWENASERCSQVSNGGH